jgi:hypothetical protein
MADLPQPGSPVNQKKFRLASDTSSTVGENLYTSVFVARRLALVVGRSIGQSYFEERILEELLTLLRNFCFF